MMTVTAEPRQTIPSYHESWFYVLPDDCKASTEVREDPDFELILDLAAERLGFTA